MCPHPKCVNNSECIRILSDFGLITEKLITSGRLEVEDFITLKLSNQKVKERVSYIVEYLLQNRETILKDKKLICLNTTQPIKSSQTSDRASTSNEKDFCPFYKESKKETYNKLWLPVKIDCVDSHLNSSNGFAHKTILSSRFSNKMISLQNKNSETICCPLSKYFAVDGMEKGGTRPKTVMRCKKIRLKPTPEQKKVLETWSSHHRYTYNKLVEAVNEKKMRVNMYEARNEFVTSMKTYMIVDIQVDENTSRCSISFRKSLVPNDFIQQHEWLRETPKEVRASAITECVSNFKACFTNLKKKNIQNFKVGFLSKKTGSWSIGLSKAVKKIDNKYLSIFPQTLGRVRYCESNPLPFDVVPPHECKIHKTKTDKYFLIVPYDKIVRESTYDTRPIVGIDPGVRTFMSCYGTDGKAYLLLDEMEQVLMPLLKKIDGLCSLISKEKSTKKLKLLRRQKLLLIEKIKNIQIDIHHKLAKFLTEKYSVIILPHFESKNMVSNQSSKLTNKTCRLMLSMAHAEFRNRLHCKSVENDTKLMICTEEFTSKTCTYCGHLNDIGSSREHNCKRCQNVFHRDINAARNMILKHIEVVSMC